MAEYGWGLSSELKNKASVELNENPEYTAEAIDVVREQIDTRPDISFLRTDDAFVLRFLRARKFDTFEAFKLFGRYFEYRQNYPNIFKDFNTSEQGVKEALFDGIPAVLENSDHFGRRIIVLYSANWDNTRYGLAAIYRAILLTLEKLIDEEESQINGFVIIVDWSQFTFRQSTWLNPNVLRQMIEGLQDCFPARFAAVHFVNQPWYIEAMFKMLKPFLKEKNKNKIHFHGINLGTLHNEIHKEALPAELGGTQPPYNNQYWAKQLIGDENFSFSDKHIYWPNQTQIRARSKSFPSSFYNTSSKPTEDVETEVYSDDEKAHGTYLDEEFFLID
ncbi:clavesin-2-like [Ruditapes philippinarum]|uniref:clavesin-2-like n=1 Tax=Ruditapes philippinarum TaxID=129788 RepID=UPI00295BFA4A|nr:clavesin-2-like [Ruditapes philippinarum]XP_060594967.1 clavesin-2-like [Ruditapes philippinarum]XP_060594968.1 clavesin-2-like [Ruditapes philippinarum]XP_060594969.1 clavesin-2-like [Ruditapes philippinarum]